MKRRFLLAVTLLVVALAACAKLPAPANRTGTGTGTIIKLAAFEVTPAKRGTDRAVELKEDGAVFIDGKMAARIAGDHVDSANGTSMLTVAANGRLVGGRVGPGFKFEGDDLVTDAGA